MRQHTENTCVCLSEYLYYYREVSVLWHETGRNVGCPVDRSAARSYPVLLAGLKVYDVFNGIV